MVRADLFVPEHQQGEQGEDQQCNDFLDHLELDQGKGSAVLYVSDPVGRYLEAVFKQGNTPADEDDGYQSQFAKPFPLVKF